MNKAFIFVIIAECWMTIGQICFKKGADRLKIEEVSGKSWIVHVLGSLLCYPSLWMGAAAMLVGLVFWLTALGSGELNYVYPLGSIQYIFALFAAHFFLQERITLNKSIGTVLITLGIILTMMS